MSVDINHSETKVKEEIIDSDSGLDAGCKSDGFLYVDMNDYNENNFNGIDLKEEEEQVEELIFDKNTSENDDSYHEEDHLPLNSLKNLANHSPNDLTVTEIQTVNEGAKKKRKLHSKTNQKENISSKTELCQGYVEDSGPKTYTLRSRKQPQRNLTLDEKSRNCLKIRLTDLEGYSDIKKESFKCQKCKSVFYDSSLWNAHVEICPNKLKHGKVLKPENDIVLGKRTIFRASKYRKKSYFKCNMCGKSFKKKKDLTSHILKSECCFEEFVCELCSETFLGKNILKKHIISHLQKTVQCQWCFESFKTSKDLKNHVCFGARMKEECSCKCKQEPLQANNQENQSKDIENNCCHSEKSKDNHSLKVSYPKVFNCQVCRENFTGIIAYIKHLRRHKNINDSDTEESCFNLHLMSTNKKFKFRCEICGKFFDKLVKLKIHILNIHQGVNYQCFKCTLKFASLEELETHKASGECKPEDLCTCKTCGKVFAKKDYLKKHQYMHANVLFRCKHCYCAFMKEKSYNKHMEKMNCSKSARKIRMAEFNFKKCRLCEIEYETEELLIEHFEISHIGLKPHQCFCCDLCLPTFAELESHIHQHNIQKYTCNLCGKPYTSQEGYRKHRLKHKGAEFKCKFCDAEFLKEIRFRLHEKTCKKNPDCKYTPSQKKEKPQKKDSKPKQSRQLHWESRIIMKRLRGDPALSQDQNSTVEGKEGGSAAMTFFDESDSEMSNERGWFDNYYKTEEDDIAFGLKKGEECGSQDNSDLDMSEFLLKGPAQKKSSSSPPATALGSDAAEDGEAEAVDNYSESSETSSTDSDEVEMTDLPIDYNPKKCRICIISFGQEYELLHHFIKSHPSEYAHKCPQCEVQCPLYAQLKEHMKIHGIGIGIFNCDNCSKQFKSEKKMKSHNIRCKGISDDGKEANKKLSVLSDDETCKRCGKKFQTKCSYRRHKQLCKKKSKSSTKVATTDGKLDESKKSVAEGLTEGNDSQFSEPEEETLKPDEDVRVKETKADTTVKSNRGKPEDASSVTNNVPKEEKKAVVKNTYAGEPPLDSFPCRLCDKKFQYERGIVMHFKTAHPGQKPLICHVCNMQLADKLKEHLKTHGIGEEFVCELCGKRFNQKFLSKIHEMWHQGIEYKCNNCKQKFLNKEKMDKHIGENRCSNRQSLMRLPCSICGKSYRSKFGLSKHYITHTPKELRPVKNRMNCEYCGKWFENNNGLQRHRRIHTGERPFCCRFCPKAFAQEGNCKAHERIHTGESKPRKKKPSAVPPTPSPTPPPSDPQVVHVSTVPATSSQTPPSNPQVFHSTTLPTTPNQTLPSNPNVLRVSTVPTTSGQTPSSNPQALHASAVLPRPSQTLSSNPQVPRASTVLGAPGQAHPSNPQVLRVSTVPATPGQTLPSNSQALHGSAVLATPGQTLPSNPQVFHSSTVLARPSQVPPSNPQVFHASTVLAPPGHTNPPPNPQAELPHVSTVPVFSVPSSAVGSVTYPGHITLYSCNNVDPNGIVH